MFGGATSVSIQMTDGASYCGKVRELEIQLEEERSQRSQSSSSKKHLEAELQDTESQLEMATRGKEEAMKQLKRLQVAQIIVVDVKMFLFSSSSHRAAFWDVGSCATVMCRCLKNLRPHRLDCNGISFNLLQGKKFSVRQALGSPGGGLQANMRISEVAASASSFMCIYNLSASHTYTNNAYSSPTNQSQSVKPSDKGSK